MLNNCIKAYEIRALRLVPRAQAVVVRRDPRDQFVALVQEGGIGAVSARQFVQWFRRREWALSACPPPTAPRDIDYIARTLRGHLAEEAG